MQNAAEDFDLCDAVLEKPYLIDISYPGCPPCEDLSLFLSEDGTGSYAFDMWYDWADNINDLLESGDLGMVTMVFDLADFSNPVAPAWEANYPHDDIVLIESGSIFEAIEMDQLQTVVPGFPSFYLVGTDMTVTAMQIDNATPEGAYNALIQANAL